MNSGYAKWIISGICFLLAACVTVNVYFPEKDVKQAYKSLDEMLLKQGDKNAPQESAPPETEPRKPETKPVSFYHSDHIYSIILAPNAFAQEDMGKRLAEELAQMPEVQKAYADIKARIPQVNALRESGAVGEGAFGELVVLDKAKLGNNQALVDAMNNDRKTVIFAMAKATLKITGQPVNSQTVKKARIDAAKTFASVRQEKAKPGWFIQLPNGRWVQK